MADTGTSNGPTMIAILIGGLLLYSGITNNKLIDTIMGRANTGPNSGDVKSDGTPATAGNNAFTAPTNEPAPAGIRAAVVTEALNALHLAPYGYAETRPMASSLEAGQGKTDCSAFFTLVYKAAGAPDPNGSSYNGSGNTSTLESHGKVISVAQLRPGDGVFYSSPDHVAIYVGGGNVVEHGSAASPHEVNVNYRTPTAYRSFLP